MVLANQKLSALDFARIRGAVNGDIAFMTWTGNCFAMLPEKCSVKLFDIMGMNVCRCAPLEDESWVVVSRELCLYLDPSKASGIKHDTDTILHSWRNPFTEQVVPVVHVANERVQFHLTEGARINTFNNIAILPIEIPITYPNPLKNTELASYSPTKFYQAFESFNFSFDLSELEQDSPKVEKLAFTWTRFSPWLPWMNMGTMPGQLIFSASGCKLDSFDDLPPLLKAEITNRVPIYRTPPPYATEEPNVTSWTYFSRNFDAYLQGQRFPLTQEL